MHYLGQTHITMLMLPNTHDIVHLRLMLFANVVLKSNFVSNFAWVLLVMACLYSVCRFYLSILLAYHSNVSRDSHVNGNLKYNGIQKHISSDLTLFMTKNTPIYTYMDTVEQIRHVTTRNLF